MVVEVLEEALGVKSVLPDKVFELINDTLHICFLCVCSIRSSIGDVSASSSNLLINILFKSLFSEDFVNIVAECSPFNVIALFWCFVGSAQFFKFRLRNLDFGHVETDSELSSCNEARS